MDSKRKNPKQSRTELHFHLLPDVDDGPDTIEESVELARVAFERDETATIVATPHVRGDQLTDVGELPTRVAEVEAALATAGVPVRVHRGGELGHDMVGRLSQVELGSIALGPPTGRWLLLEAPFDAGAGPAFHAAAEELRDRGFGVLIAHAERCAALLHHEQAGLRRELELGALAQVNASSLIGWHGVAAAADGLRLIEQGLAVVG
ncbi:MAG: CpsB/CapC family capsule biosynthesis tyrosine phosphatase, partial [Thermoleophilaceae bacterium]